MNINVANSLIYILISFSLAAFVSCSEDKEQPGIGETSVEITAKVYGGRHYDVTGDAAIPSDNDNMDMYWSPRDTLGVFGDNSGNIPFVNSLTSPQDKASFRGTIAGSPKHVYSPYAKVAGPDVTRLSGSLPAEQMYDPDTRYVSCDYKYCFGEEGTSGEFGFRRLFCLLRLDVNAGGTEMEGEQIEGITVTAPAGRALSGDFTFSAVDGSYVMNTRSETVGMKLVKPVELADGKTITGYAVCAPDIRTGDRLTVTIHGSKKTATFTAESLVDFQSNGVYVFTLNLRAFAEGDHDWCVTDIKGFRSFEFTVAANPGKILDKKVQQSADGSSISESEVLSEVLTIKGNEISGVIPYLFDFNLVPTFSVAEGVTVRIGGAVQNSGETPCDFSSPVTYTLEAPDGTKDDYTVTVSNTGLPIVVINQSASISNGSWLSWFGSLKVREKTADWVSDDRIAVYNADGSVDVATTNCGVRLRGNSTQRMPKKPFALKLDSKQKVCGMPSHKRWVLLANWMDYSMIRNHAAFTIAHAVEKAWKNGSEPEGIRWNPSGTNVEVVIDGHHVGNYYLCEQIKIGSKRLDIKDAYEDVVSDGEIGTFENCGYLLECDLGYDENCKFMTSVRYLPFMFKDDVPDYILNSVKTKVDGIDRNLAARNYAEAYKDLDIYSVIDQWIVNEVTMNEEFGHPKSVYMYMDGGDSRLCAGPVWDYDWQTFPNIDNIRILNSRPGTYQAYTPKNLTGEWLYKDSRFDASHHIEYGPQEADRAFMWYPVLFKDEAFRTAVQERWKVVYPHLLAVGAELSPLADANRLSWEVNRKMWPSLFRRDGSFASCFNGDEAMTDYGEVVRNLISRYELRLDWMNEQITNGKFVTTAR